MVQSFELKDFKEIGVVLKDCNMFEIFDINAPVMCFNFKYYTGVSEF